ncbi:cytochrome c biogenesis protein CcdA [Thermoproteota archaeon]
MNLVDNPLAFLIAFGSGVVVSFSPCVYPLLPVTVGYIGANARGSRLKGFFLSSIYALGIATTYSILGAIAGLAGKIFGQITSGPWTYIILANLCIFFGLVLLGVFNIPFLNIVPRKVEPKGALTTFLFGMASGFVISPCTVPALGAILAYVGSKQNVAYGMLLLFCFAYGLCTTVILAGTFSSVLVNLPKSGKWLEVIKKLCGLLLIGVGEYFLIQAGVCLI